LLLRDLATRLECRLEGDDTLDITGIAGIEEAGPGQLTFFANPRLKALLAASRASAIILGDDPPPVPPPAQAALLRSRNPYYTFARALEIFHPAVRPAPGIHPTAIVDPTAVLGPDVHVGPYAVIDAEAQIGARAIIHAHVTIGARARIGDDCLFHTRVAIREGVILGHRIVVQNGAVIGADGFGFAKGPDGHHYKIPQVGTVIIEDDVEIGANTTIDRASIGATRVRSGTKIDNLVQIAHSVLVGHDVLLAAQVGIAGSSVIEDQAMLGGQVGITGHVTVGKGAALAAQSGVTGNVRPGSFLSGYPAIDNLAWRKASVVFERLPEMRKQLLRLEERLASIVKALNLED